MPSNTQELLKTINGSLGKLSKSMGATEQRMYSKTLMNIKGLEYDVSNKLVQNTQNTKILGDVKRDLDKILRSPGYKNAVIKFGKSYDVVSKVQNDWFSSMVEDFKPSGAVNVAQRTATRQMVDNLIGGGVSQAVSQKVGNAILQNMQSGGTIAQVNNVVRELLIGDKSTPGRLTAYSGQIATDGINQYARAYNLQVTEDLGFEWYEYVGSVKDTTRPFCLAAVKQRWLHKSELGKASKGILRAGKVSTEGMYPDLTIDKFLLTAGGYRCGHQLRGVSAKRVPASLRNTIGFTKTGETKPAPKNWDELRANVRKDKIQKIGAKDDAISLDSKSSEYFGNSVAKNKSLLKKQFAVEQSKIRKGGLKNIATSSFYGENYDEYIQLTKKYKNDFKDYYVDGIKVYNKDVPPIYQYIKTDDSVLGGTWNRKLKQVHPPKPLMELLGKNMQNGFPNTGTVKGIPAIQFSSKINGGQYQPGDNVVAVNPLNKRWATSRIYPRKVVTHEYGHATSYNLGLEYYDYVDLKAIRWDGSTYNYKSSSRYSVPNNLLKGHADKGFKIIVDSKGGQSSLNKLDKMFGVKNTKWSRKPLEDEFIDFQMKMGRKLKDLGYAQADTDEMISVAKDLLSASTKGKHGGGHHKLYFMDASQLNKSEAQGWMSYKLPQVNNNNYSEYVAHSSDYVFNGGNPVIDELYPGLGENFTDFWADVLNTYLK